MLARRKEPAPAQDSYALQRAPLGMILMYGAGLISALLGIGSGVLKIPAMDNRIAAALQGLFGNIQFHDRRDGGRQRGRELCPRRNCHFGDAGELRHRSHRARTLITQDELPLRVGALLIFFLRARDYRYGAIAALVLFIIFISFFIGAR